MPYTDFHIRHNTILDSSLQLFCYYIHFIIVQGAYYFQNIGVHYNIRPGLPHWHLASCLRKDTTIRNMGTWKPYPFTYLPNSQCQSKFIEVNVVREYAFTFRQNKFCLRNSLRKDTTIRNMGTWWSALWIETLKPSAVHNTTISGNPCVYYNM
jgi:hypothetical protein